MRRIARGLSELELQIEVVLTSPYIRAADTARILLKQLGLRKDQLVMMEDLAPGGDMGRLMQQINQEYAGMDIALVGHEPSLSRLISVLISGDPTIPIVLKKGGACSLAIDKLEYGRCASLEWLMTPAQLIQING